MKRLRVIISGGGTGGHIFPALAIAKAIEKKVPDVKFLFVGAKGRMEMEKIPIAGYDIVGLWISGFQRRKFIKNLLFPIKVLYSIYKANIIIKDFKPHLAIGTGGYASAPLIYAAARKGIPSVIQEQNAYPGITNKILSRYVEKICVSYDKMFKFFPREKVILTGNPIREDVLGFKDKKQEGERLFNLDNKKLTVLVIGGSLGALTINKAIAKNIHKFKDNGVNLIWQTGKDYYQISTKCISDVNIKGINSYAFIEHMNLAYASSDIIISRAGAISIAELCCIGKPIILVPSPNVSENHQFKNAQSLVNKNAALLVDDADVSCKLVSTLEKLLCDKSLMNLLSSNIKKLSVFDASDRITKIALDLLK